MEYGYEVEFNGTTYEAIVTNELTGEVMYELGSFGTEEAAENYLEAWAADRAA